MHFAGWVDNAVNALSIADAFVMPSHKEVFGNVVLEAWSQHLPVVSSATDGGRELIRDGVNGLIYPVGDVAALTRALRRLLDSDALREQLAGAGYADYRRRFSAERTLAAYAEFYDHMLRHVR